MFCEYGLLPRLKNWCIFSLALECGGLYEFIEREREWEGKMERQIEEEEEGGGERERRERLHSGLTAHIVSLWSQLGSDWWHNYNVDMRYLHKGATIIHSHILFTEHMTPQEPHKACWILLRATSCVHVVEFVPKFGRCERSCNYTYMRRRDKHMDRFLGFTGTLFGISSLAFRWDILCQNKAGCSVSWICMFLCVVTTSTFTLLWR